VEKADGSFVEVNQNPVFDAEKETITLGVAYPGFESGEIYTVKIQFVSRIGDDRYTGLYLSKLVDGTVEL
jgi:hypothetical protein